MAFAPGIGGTGHVVGYRVVGGRGGELWRVEWAERSAAHACAVGFGETKQRARCCKSVSTFRPSPLPPPSGRGELEQASTLGEEEGREGFAVGDFVAVDHGEDFIGGEDVDLDVLVFLEVLADVGEILGDEGVHEFVERPGEVWNLASSVTVRAW